MGALWAGIDAGKRAHHCVVIDTDGTVVLSRRVDNDESRMLDLIGQVLALADGDLLTWATELNTGGVSRPGCHRGSSVGKSTSVWSLPVAA